MAIQLYLKGTETLLSTLTEDQLDALLDAFEKESDDDHDYYIDADALEFLVEEGVDERLVAVLRTALQEHGKVAVSDEEPSVEVEWRQV